MNYAFLLKCIIIGDSGVGKSCLLLQYTDKRYREKHEVTIGVQFGAKMLVFNQNNIKLQIWDTAGQESFKAITRSYYRNAIGAIVVYDVSDRDSFTHLIKWLEEAKSNGPPSLTFVLVGNKSDKSQQRKVTYEEGKAFAHQQGIQFLQTCAKTGSNVDQIFNLLTSSILTKIENSSIQIQNNPGIKVGGQKYIGMTSNLTGRIQKRESVLIGQLIKRQKEGCCNN